MLLLLCGALLLVDGFIWVLLTPLPALLLPLLLLEVLLVWLFSKALREEELLVLLLSWLSVLCLFLLYCSLLPGVE
jgi:hypothetical protein